MRVKPLVRIVATWAAHVKVAGPDYTAGVNNPKQDWAQAASAAKDTYAAGVSAAIANDSYTKGIQKAGSAKWKERTLAVGPSRWIQGVAASGTAYVNGLSPYITVLSNLDLPPRGAAGDPANYDRVRIIGEALHARKLQGGA